ncbi:MAG: hypothetical protein R6V62_06525 [Candidatus Fermentibacteraceae bacterium]
MNAAKKVFMILFLLAACSLPGCGGPETENTNGEEAIPVVSLPGTLSRPDTSGFTPVPTDSLDGVLLYIWIPLENCDQSDPDLVFLATLAGSGILPAPVQFDTDSRNASQSVLNRLGLPLTAYLGDQSLLDFVDPTILPAAVLVLPGGIEHRADGVGCAQRLLRDSR